MIMPTNIPTKESDVLIKCRKVDDYYEFLTSEGWMIETCHSANDFANLVTYARDMGFAQGLASVRKALGIKEKW
jgi:hypothetical protein